MSEQQPEEAPAKSASAKVQPKKVPQKGMVTAISEELPSLKKLPKKEIAALPQVGSRAPGADRLAFPQPKPVLLVFLQYCGWPFAEKTFKALAKLSMQHPEVHFVAVSHSSKDVTERWVMAVGGAWEVEVIVDEERDLYAQWGLGLSSYWSALNPWQLYSLYRVGAAEGIWTRPAESGSIWQVSGAFAVDAAGFVKSAHVAKGANDVPDLAAALATLQPGASVP